MKTIRINAFQFDDHAGHERSNLLLCGEEFINPGTQVVLEVWSTNDSMPTGASIIRWVEDCQFVGSSRNDDDFMVLSLCAFKPNLPDWVSE